MPPVSVPPPTTTGKPSTEPPKEDPGETRVGLDEPAEVLRDVVIRLASIESVQGEAQGPGEVAGPALRVTVEVANQTGSALSLAGIAVNLYYGVDTVPAVPLDGPGVVAFPASVAAGRAGSGTAVFSVPADQRDLVAVEVTLTASQPLVVFEGRP